MFHLLCVLMRRKFIIRNKFIFSVSVRSWAQWNPSSTTCSPSWTRKTRTTSPCLYQQITRSQLQLLQLFIQLNNETPIAWVLSMMHSIVLNLRIISYKADKVLSAEKKTKPGLLLEKVIEQLRELFRACVNWRERILKNLVLLPTHNWRLKTFLKEPAEHLLIQTRHQMTKTTL